MWRGRALLSIIFKRFFGQVPVPLGMALAFWILIPPAPAWGQSAGSDELFREALICYGEINFECTLEKLERARDLERSGANDARRLTEIHRYMAFALVALGRETEARQTFRAILEIDPGFELSADKVSPKIHDLYLSVKRSLEERSELRKTKPEPQTAPPPEVKPKPVAKEKAPAAAPPVSSKNSRFARPDGLAGLTFGAAFLSGKDTDHYGVGFATGGFVETHLANGFYLGGALFFQRNGGKTGGPNLNLMGVTARPAWIYAFERFFFHLPLDVGFVTFGRGGLTDEQGLLWRLEPGFFVRFEKHFAIGATVGSGGVFLFDPEAASVFFNVGMALMGTW